MNVRRVVTGHSDGRAAFVADEVIEPITAPLLPGCEFYRLWSLDQVPTLPTDGTSALDAAWYPPAGGLRFSLFTLPPGDVSPPPDLDLATAVADVEAKLPGLLGALDPSDPGMHRSDSVDFILVLSGEVGLEVRGDAEKVLRPGDAVVQNATWHRWKNRGETPVVLAVFQAGAADGKART